MYPWSTSEIKKGDLVNYYWLTNPYPVLMYRRIAVFAALRYVPQKKHAKSYKHVPVFFAKQTHFTLYEK
jgi:hypothetical protein